MGAQVGRLRRGASLWWVEIILIIEYHLYWIYSGSGSDGQKATEEQETAEEVGVRPGVAILLIDKIYLEVTLEAGAALGVGSGPGAGCRMQD